MAYRPVRSPLTWLGGLLALYLLVPLVAFAIRFAGSSDRGLGAGAVWSAMRISAETATISMLLVAAFGIPLAHWLARSSGPVAAIVGVLVQLPLALPPLMSGIVLIYLVGPYSRIGELFGGRLTDTMIGIVIAQTFVSAPFLIIAARSAFATVDPSLRDLAATLGHRPAARFRLVDLHVAADGIRAGLLLSWLRSLGEYGATVLLAYHPNSLPVFTYIQFSSTGIPATQAPTALALAIAIVIVSANCLRRPGWLRRAAVLPEPRAPVRSQPTPVAFDLDHRIGTFHLRIAYRAESQRLAILGPSGAGKSITLRSLAGLLGPDVGEVRYGGESVSRKRTENRRVGYVPQNLGLFPQRRVWQQLCFGVGADPALAAWWLHTLQLDTMVDREPGELSGGQRQRVSLAQSMSREPRLVLLDEPFSALDAPVREQLRRELRRLQRENGLSTVLVTHDPEEAALLADEVLVIDDGQLLQAGRCAEVFRRPASPRVARLLGIQNLNSAVVTSSDSITAAGVALAADSHGLEAGTELLWSIRPEQIGIRSGGAYPAVLTDLADLGTLVTAGVQLADGLDLVVRTTDELRLEPGQSCRVDLPPGHISLWPAPASEPPAADGAAATR